MKRAPEITGRMRERRARASQRRSGERGIWKRRSTLALLALSICLVLTGGGAVSAGRAATPDGSQSVYDALHQKDKPSGKSHDAVAPSDAKKDVKDGAPAASGTSGLFTFLKLVVSLAVILGLIYLLYRLMHKHTRSYRKVGAIRNLGGVAVGPNRSVQLVRIGETILVVGVGETVQLLKEITDPETVAQLLNEDEAPPEFGKTLSKVLARAKGRALPENHEQPDGGQSASSFDQQLKALLKSRSDALKDRLRKDNRDE